MLRRIDPLKVPGGDHPSVVILSRWLTPNIIFTPIAISITLGVLPAFFFSLALFLAVSVIVFTFRRRFSVHEHTMDEWLGKVLSDRALKWVRFCLTCVSYGQLYLLTLGGGIIFQALFYFSIQVSMFIFLGLAMMFVWAKPAIPHRHHVKVGFFLLSLTGLLVYIFMTKSLDEIYDGIRLFHPYLLYMNWNRELLFLFVVF